MPSKPSDTSFGGKLDRIVMLAKHPHAPVNVRNQAVQYVIKQVTPAIYKWINMFGMNLGPADKEELAMKAMEGIHRFIEQWDPTKGASFFTFLFDPNLKFLISDEVKRLRDRMLSLEQESPFGKGEENLPLSAIIPDVMQKDDPRSVAIQNAIKTLNPQERQIVSLAFGFKDPEFNPDGKNLTQGEIATILGLTQSRINIALSKALDRLRPLLTDLKDEYNRSFEYPERSPFEEGELGKIGSAISFDYKGTEVTGYIVKTFIKNGKIMHRVYLPTQGVFGDQYLNAIRKD